MIKYNADEMGPLHELLDQIEAYEIVRVLDLVGYEYSLGVIKNPGGSQVSEEKAAHIIWVIRFMRDIFCKMTNEPLIPF